LRDLSGEPEMGKPPFGEIGRFCAWLGRHAKRLSRLTGLIALRFGDLLAFEG
jgi:hypothetical protein